MPEQIVLGPLATDAKSNEITTVPKLLDMLDLEGAVVTVDALNCQKTFAKKAIARQADCALQVKGNQSHLHEDLKLLFAQGLRDDCQGVPYAYAEEITGGHGRIETRWLWSLDVQFREDDRRMGPRLPPQTHYPGNLRMRLPCTNGE